jgi:hypothetical protein
MADLFKIMPSSFIERIVIHLREISINGRVLNTVNTYLKTEVTLKNYNYAVELCAYYKEFLKRFPDEPQPDSSKWVNNLNLTIFLDL